MSASDAPSKTGDATFMPRARDAERVEHDVDRGAVGQVGHVLDGEDAGDDALVAVASGHLVALGDLPLLGDVDPDQLVDPGGQLVT